MSNMLISHWHCIIPVAVILLAMVFMHGKNSRKGEQNENITNGGDENVE